MRKYLIVSLIIILLLAASLCTKKDMRSITVNGQTYPFNNNLFEVIKIKSKNESEIRTLIENANQICIDYKNSTKDASLFSVVGFNLVFRITRFYSLKGEEKNISVCKSEPRILFLGPNSGAEEDSVTLVNKTIIVQGTTRKSFEMASDKLSLIIFGVDEKYLEEQWVLTH